MFDINIVIGIGSSSAISTSKIMKISAIKKNRDEKGSRVEFFGSKPHSTQSLYRDLRRSHTLPQPNLDKLSGNCTEVHATNFNTVLSNHKTRYFYISCSIFSVKMNIITITQFGLKETSAISLFLNSINKL